MEFRQADIEKLLVQTGRRCCICKGLHTVSVHHIDPRGQGGSNDIENGIPLCPNCHDQVHSGGSPGRITKKYTESELKQHRQFTIDLIAQSVAPFGGNPVQTTSVAPIGPNVSTLLKMLSDGVTSVTLCCIEGIEVAKAIENSELELFCRDELAGYTRYQGEANKNIDQSDHDKVKYRTVESYVFLSGRLDPNFIGLMTGAILIERMKADPDKFMAVPMLYPEPVSEIEMHAKTSDPNGLLEICMSYNSFVPTVPDDGTKPIGMYLAGDTPGKVLKAIRREFMSRLVALV